MNTSRVIYSVYEYTPQAKPTNQRDPNDPNKGEPTQDPNKQPIREPNQYDKNIVNYLLSFLI